MKKLTTQEEDRKGFAKVTLMMMDKGTTIYTHSHKIKGSNACYTRLYMVASTPEGSTSIQDITHLYLSLFSVPLREHKGASVSGIRTRPMSSRMAGKLLVSAINQAIEQPDWFQEARLES